METSDRKKTALITGASRGIGAAIFRALAASGVNVIGTATSEAGAAAINDTGLALPGGGLIYDARSSEQAERLAQTAQEVNGGESVDILVVNAAINADSLLLRMKAADWDAVIQANLTASFVLSQALMRGMIKKRWGRIIFLSSIVASLGNPGQANYCAAKAGVEGYARALAREVAARGITVNTIAPGFIDTDMTARLPDAVKKHFMDNIPVGRAGLPEEVAAAACYLAGDSAGYVTGQVLHINGGMYMG